MKRKSGYTASTSRKSRRNDEPEQRKPTGQTRRGRARPGRRENEQGRRVIIVDCETDPFRHGRVPDPFLWGTWEPATGALREFDRTADCAAWLAQQDAVVYAHNGGKFDWHYLLPFCSSSRISVINGRLARLRLGRAELRDSWLILPVALRGYKKDDIEYWKMEKDVRAAWRDEIRSYLSGDLTYTGEMVAAFRAAHGDALTLAGAALKDCAARCELDLPDTSANYYKAWSQWYHGGRVEARRGRFRGPITVVDIVSAYPWAMAQCSHPWGAEWRKRRPSSSVLPEGLYRVQGAGSGAFPVIGRDGRLSFPEGAVEACITGHELIAARAAGIAPEVVAAWEPVESVDFSPFVGHHFRVKTEAPKDSPERLLAKLTMNSGYGKLGACPENYRNWKLSDWSFAEEDMDREGYRLYAELHGRPLLARPLRPEEERFYDVATAASITGAVRARLFSAMNAVGREHVLYADTDSLFLGPGAKLDCLEIGSGLGEWEIQGVYDTAAIAGKKLYALRREKNNDCKTASKGVRLSADEIERVEAGEEVVYRSEAPFFSVSRGTGFVTRKVSAS